MNEAGLPQPRIVLSTNKEIVYKNNIVLGEVVESNQGDSMKKKYMIRREFYGLMPNLGVFDTKSLAERQIDLLPEVMTDYDHFVVEEIPCPECEEEFAIDFRRANKKQDEEKSNG